MHLWTMYIVQVHSSPQEHRVVSFYVLFLLPSTIWHIIHSWKFFPFLSGNFRLRTTLSLCHWHERGKMRWRWRWWWHKSSKSSRNQIDGKNDWIWGGRHLWATSDWMHEIMNRNQFREGFNNLEEDKLKRFLSRSKCEFIVKNWRN